jgi:polysaccharide deacetylase family protein (PEP-CTERM system associated)
MLNALTIDYEDWYQGLEIPHTDWDGFADRLPEAHRRLLDLLEQTGVRATFFVLGRVAERHPELVRDLAARGHEIATHGQNHTLIYKQTPDAFRAELTRAVRVLQDLVGKPVLGHRAPFFSITRASLWAFEVLGELGLRYDSSIYPVLNYRYGIEDAERWPHPIAAGGGTLLEFPISTWRLAGRNVPIAGGAYFRILPYAFTRAGLRAINRGGHPAVFYLHPWELDADHPRVRLPHRIALTHYANLGATERRLRRLLRDFRFAPMREVLGVA